MNNNQMLYDLVKKEKEIEERLSSNCINGSQKVKKDLEEKWQEIHKELNAFAKENMPDHLEFSDEIIDLYNVYEDSTHYFEHLIYLHNTSSYVGYIKYRGKAYYYDLGSIDCEIEKEKRGHNLSLHALNLITPKIKETGVDTFRISVGYTNIEATHLIEKFGAKLAFDCDPREGILHYNVQIEKINNNVKK